MAVCCFSHDGDKDLTSTLTTATVPYTYTYIHYILANVSWNVLVVFSRSLSTVTMVLKPKSRCLLHPVPPLPPFCASVHLKKTKLWCWGPSPSGTSRIPHMEREREGHGEYKKRRSCSAMQQQCASHGTNRWCRQAAATWSSSSRSFRTRCNWEGSSDYHGGGQEPPPGHCDRMCFIPRALTVPSRHGPKQPPGPTLIIVLTGDNHFFIFTSWGIKSHSSCFFKIIIYEQQQLLLCIHPGPLKVGPSLRAQVRTAPPWHTSGRVTHYLIM